MAIEGYADLDATDLARLISEGELSELEVLEEAIERAERVNPQLNALVYPWYDHARERAAAGLPEGPFHGVPFLLKDLGTAYAGQMMSSGSRIYADDVAGHDHAMTARYKAAGLSIFGRSTSPEFGLTATTESLLHGKTRNPWNLEHTSGGSSGGASALTAAGVLPIANASDGGGSIRIPASCTGLFGLKPTRGRTPMGPDVGEGWAGMSTIHAVSKSVRDSALLLDCTAGPDAGAPYFAPPPERPWADEAGRDPGKLRVGVVRAAFNEAEVHPDCLAAVEHAADLCRQLDLEVDDAHLKIPEQLRSSSVDIIRAATRVMVEDRAAALGREPNPEDVEPLTWRMIQADRSSGADYLRATRAVHATGRIVAGWFADYDVMLTPTMAQPPMEIGRLALDREDYMAQGQDILSAVAFTATFNAAGNPAASVPLYWNDAGLPIGTQFAARYGDEATLFRLAGALEQLQPWAGRKPPVHSDA